MIRSFLVLLALIITWPANAVVSQSGAGNTSAPADDPGWANVGDRAGNTGIYIGYQWYITAHHVGCGSIVLQGVTYNSDKCVRVPSAITPTLYQDLYLVHLTSDPGLPPIPIVTSTGVLDEDVILIGNTSYVIGAPFTQQVCGVGITCSGPFTGTRSGWELTGGGSAKRWGTNKVGYGGVVVDNFGYLSDGQPVAVNGIGYSFSAPADPTWTTHESIGWFNDSGGPVLVKRDGVWQLLGIMSGNPHYMPSAVQFLDPVGQSANAPGDRTTSSDLSFVVKFITDTIHPARAPFLRGN